MKRGGPLKRNKPLTADREKIKEWQDRSRQPLKSGDKSMKRTEMPKKPSKRKRARAAEVDALREAIEERSGGWCEARLPLVCMGAATNIHHRLPEGAGGPATMANLIHLCGSGTTGCHGWVEHNRKACYPPEGNALLLRRGQDPENYPYIRPRRVT